MSQPYLISLTREELETVAVALGAMPYRDVADLFARIQQQIEAADKVRASEQE